MEKKDLKEAYRKEIMEIAKKINTEQYLKEIYTSMKAYIEREERE